MVHSNHIKSFANFYKKGKNKNKKEIKLLFEAIAKKMTKKEWKKLSKNFPSDLKGNLAKLVGTNL